METSFVCEKCESHYPFPLPPVRDAHGGSDWCMACVRYLIKGYEEYKRKGWGNLLVLYEPGKTHAVGHVFDGLLHLHVGAGQFRKLSPEEYNEGHGTQATVMTEAKCLREMIAVVKPDYVPPWESIDD